VVARGEVVNLTREKGLGRAAEEIDLVTTDTFPFAPSSDKVSSNGKPTRAQCSIGSPAP